MLLDQPNRKSYSRTQDVGTPTKITFPLENSCCWLAFKGKVYFPTINPYFSCQTWILSKIIQLVQYLYYNFVYYQQQQYTTFTYTFQTKVLGVSLSFNVVSMKKFQMLFKQNVASNVTKKPGVKIMSNLYKNTFSVSK